MAGLFVCCRCLLVLFVGIVCWCCLLFVVFLFATQLIFHFCGPPPSRQIGCVFSYFETFGANNTVNTITNVFCASEARNYSIYDAFKTSGRKNLYLDNAFVPVPSTNADICPDFSMLQDVVLIC